MGLYREREEIGLYNKREATKSQINSSKNLDFESNKSKRTPQIPV